MLRLDPSERPSIFDLQKHSYLNSDIQFKKISFLVYSTESYSHFPKESLKKKLQQFLNHDMYDYVMELFSRSYGLKMINDVQINDSLRIGICILIACKLLKQALPVSYFTLAENMGGLGLSSQDQKLIFHLETKFCEHLSFRLHISPSIAHQSSTSDS